METRKRVLSGIQPTGNVHVGNYFGAIQNWVAHQDEVDGYFCIVDLHAITVPQTPDSLRTHVRTMATLLLACGLDPLKSTLFIQSHVHAHAELGWILNCNTPLGWLQRMTQFKDKSQNQEHILAGLMNYPTLMAADILLYDPDYIPVGDDQKQHVELTRDLAIRMNRHFGEVFRVPEPQMGATGARIMGLQDATRKMSKSDEDPKQWIGLLEPIDQIRKKIARAKTDSGTTIVMDPNRPEITNLLTLFQCVTGWSQAAIEAHFDGKNYGGLKGELADRLIAMIEPIQTRFNAFSAGDVDTILRDGQARAEAIANQTLARVYSAMGLR